jgi:hypothetical protein
MTAMEEAPKSVPKKKAAKKATPDVVVDTAPALSVVKLKPKPGAKDFDWQTEYPGEEVYVFTSSDGITVGLTRLGPHRKPKPGLLRRLHREGGMSVMWYFIELASSPASLKVQEKLEEEDYTAMLRGWAEFAGIELSE